MPGAGGVDDGGLVGLRHQQDIAVEFQGAEVGVRERDGAAAQLPGACGPPQFIEARAARAQFGERPGQTGIVRVCRVHSAQATHAVDRIGGLGANSSPASCPPTPTWL